MITNNPHEVIETGTKSFKDAALNYSLIILGSSITIIVFLIAFSKWGAVSFITSKLNIDPVKDLPIAVSACIGLIAILLGVERSSDMYKLKKNLDSQTKEMNNLTNQLQKITVSHTQIFYNLDFLRGRIELKHAVDFPESIANALNSLVPKDLNYLFSKELADYKNYLHDAINLKKIRFNSNDTFNVVYRKWLLANPKSKIFATSSPYKNYYWSTEKEDNTRIENTIQEFIKGGGEMIRIFFLKKEDFNDVELISRMKKQIKLGVTVYTCTMPSRIDGSDFFIVDENCTLTFKIYVDSNTNMKNFSCSVDKNYCEKYANQFNELLIRNDTNRFI